MWRERGCCRVSESVSSLCQVLGCCTQEGGVRGSESGGKRRVWAERRDRDMLKRRAPNGISAFSGSHWSASSAAEWMTGSLEQLPQIVLTGDRWNARASREEKQHGFLWAPPIPGPRLARRCAGMPLHSNRNLKQLYHDGFDLSTACSKCCNCHSQYSREGSPRWLLTQPSAILGRERQRPRARALVISYQKRWPPSADKRDWSGPKSKGLLLAEEAS